MKRTFTLGFALLLFVSISASATPHQRRIKTVYGETYADGSTGCATIIGPVVPLDVIGEVIRECDYTVWSWGQTNCDDWSMSYEDCDGMGGVSTGQAKDLACPAETADNGVAAARAAK